MSECLLWQAFLNTKDQYIGRDLETQDGRGIVERGPIESIYVGEDTRVGEAVYIIRRAWTARLNRSVGWNLITPVANDICYSIKDADVIFPLFKEKDRIILMAYGQYMAIFEEGNNLKNPESRT